jgi:hypothetical protein
MGFELRASQLLGGCSTTLPAPNPAILFNSVSSGFSGDSYIFLGGQIDHSFIHPFTQTNSCLALLRLQDFALGTRPFRGWEEDGAEGGQMFQAVALQREDGGREVSTSQRGVRTSQEAGTFSGVEWSPPRAPWLAAWAVLLEESPGGLGLCPQPSHMQALCKSPSSLREEAHDKALPSESPPAAIGFSFLTLSWAFLPDVHGCAVLHFCWLGVGFSRCWESCGSFPRSLNI